MPQHKMYCPRCDRVAISDVSLEACEKIIADHMDRAHPDMENYIREDDSAEHDTP